VASAAVRLVCSQWKVNHDAVVKRLVLRVPTTDEGTWAYCAPLSGYLLGGGQMGPWQRLPDDGRGYASSEQTACAHVSRPHMVHQGGGRGYARVSSLYADLSRPHILRQGGGSWRAGSASAPPPLI
jgi:hypothetical protein